MKTNKLSGVLTLFISIASLSICCGTAYAASSSSSSSSGSIQSLKVVPVKTDVTIAPGQTGQVRIGVSNNSAAPVTAQVIENDFVAGGESGQPALILDPNSYAPSHSLKRFMVPLQPVTVPAKGVSSVVVTITVPKNAQAGGYFGAVRLTPNAGSVSSNGASLGESVASLILLTVPGPTTEQLTLTDFSLQQAGTTASSFRTGKGLNLFMRFQNKGNLQESPFGQINVQSGKKVVYTYNFNQDDPKSEILPDSARVWSIPLKGFGKFGKYTVSATFSYGTKSQTIDISKTVWIIPTLYIIIVVALVVLLLLLGGGSYLFLKNYKRKILKSSRRRY